MTRSVVPAAGEPLSGAWKQRLRRRLLTWYARHARDLPWRESQDPYRVWVSEIMLQQTQVETVRPYFQQFVATFGTVAELAAADEEQVLRHWEGLGYYRRARQMHAAARELVDVHGGIFPRDVETLQMLPGIGRYTAGAIASIAFNERAPILEANTIRLLSRLIGYRQDPTRSAGQRRLWEVSAAILPRKEVSPFNQALMELGAIVCTPQQPACGRCPLAGICVANADGLQQTIPALPRRTASEALHEVAIVVRKPGRVLLRKCGRNERWAGLWDFPRFELSSESAPQAEREMVEKVHQLTGVACALGDRFVQIKHPVTRYRITLDCYWAQYVAGRLRRSQTQPVRWVRASQLPEYPLSTTGRKIARRIGASTSSGEL